MQPPRQRKSLDEGHRRSEIALVGASVRSAAQSAQTAGFLVTGLDRFADQDTLDACHRHVLLETASPSELRDSISAIGGEVPVIPVGGLAGIDGAFSDLRLLEPWPDQHQAIGIVRQPEFLVEICRGTDFRVPEMIARPAMAWPGLVRPSSAQDFTLTESCGRWLCKQLDGTGGLGTRWHEPEWHEPESNCEPESNWGLADRVYLQRWVEGRLFGATLLSNGSETVLLGVCKSRFTCKGPFPFVYCGSIGPISVPITLLESLRQLGSKLATRSRLRGLFNLDFVRSTDDQLWLLEVNPRWSGSSELIERHLRRRTGIDSLLALAIESLDGLSLDACPRDLALTGLEDPCYIKRIVFARRDLTLDQDRVIGWLNENESLHDIPPRDRRIRRGEPVCTLITRHTRSVNRVTNQRSESEASPMRRHRALIQWLSGAAIGPARIDGKRPSASVR